MNPGFAHFIDKKTEVSRKELGEQFEAVRYQAAGFHLSEGFVDEKGRSCDALFCWEASTALAKGLLILSFQISR